MAKMKETEIGIAVAQFFEGPGHEIFCEVPCQGIIDIVVKTGSVITAIECKTGFGLAVIEQAAKNKVYSHYSYIAVPKVTSSFGERLCRDYGIGVLTYKADQYPSAVLEKIAPKLQRRIVKPDLPEYCLYNTPGVQNDRWTAFSWFLEDVKFQLGRHPEGLTHKQLFDYTIRHYSKPSSLKSCLQTYLRKGYISGIEWRDNKFFLA